MSDTPRTDAVKLPSELLLLLSDPLMGPAIKTAMETLQTHARELERELDQAHAVLEANGIVGPASDVPRRIQALADLRDTFARKASDIPYAERMRRERDDAEMLLRMMVSIHRRHPFIPEKWVDAATRFAARNASPLRQGADSPCAAGNAAPSTESPDPASQGGPMRAPSDVQRGVAQSAPATHAEVLTEREHCTTCDPRPEATQEECDKWPGYYRGCMQRDEGKPINRWTCDGKGNLTRPARALTVLPKESGS